MPITNNDLRLQYKMDTGLNVELITDFGDDGTPLIDVEKEIPYLIWLEDKLVEALKIATNEI